MESGFKILPLIGAVVALSGALCLAANEKGSLSASDRAFMKAAAKGGGMEVAMGNTAAQKATNADVKSFGERMVADHSKLNEKLKSIAEKKGLTLPAKKPMEKWTSDRDYMDSMVKDHEKDLAEFQKEASETNDPDLKQFAEDTAKVIQQHLDLAKETQAKLK